MTAATEIAEKAERPVANGCPEVGESGWGTKYLALELTRGLPVTGLLPRECGTLITIYHHRHQVGETVYPHRWTQPRNELLRHACPKILLAVPQAADHCAPASA